MFTTHRVEDLAKSRNEDGRHKSDEENLCAELPHLYLHYPHEYRLAKHYCGKSARWLFLSGE